MRLHPWLGVGTDIDLSLGDAGNTPHNGYLSIAVTSGIPALVCFLLLVVDALREGRFASRRAPEAWQRPMAVAVTAALVSVLAHNPVDSMFTLPPVGRAARRRPEAADVVTAPMRRAMQLAEARPQ